MALLARKRLFLIVGSVLQFLAPMSAAFAAPYIVSTHPPCRASDPRYVYPLEDKRNGNNVGLTKIEIVFSEPVFGIGQNSLETLPFETSFKVAYYRGGEPSPSLQNAPDLVLSGVPNYSVVKIDATRFEIRVPEGSRIPLGSTTVITPFFVQNADFERVVPGDPRNRLIIGVQPMDLAADGRFNAAADITRFNQCYQNQGMPSQSMRLLLCDMYTDGVINTSDVTRVNQLLNGVQSGSVWRNYVENFPLPRIALTLTPIFPIQPATQALPLVDLGGTAIFSTNDGSYGMELWKSNGTPETTVLVRNIRPGGASSWPGFASEQSNEIQMVVMGSTVYFPADDGSTGRELWKSDGTLNGTVRVADINSGANSSNPKRLTVVNNTLFFLADDGINGPELWKTTGSGATLVANINPTPGAGLYTPPDTPNLVGVNGTLFFAASDGNSGTELWSSNGVNAVRVKDINPSGSSDPVHLTNINGLLIFAANDGTSGRELWRSDGTHGGTYQIKDIFSGSGASAPSAFFPHAANVFLFTASNGSDGFELWRSDGSAPGTYQVKNINPGVAESSFPYQFVQLGNVTYFGAHDEPLFGNPPATRKFYRTDGTASGTQRIEFSSIVEDLFVFDGKLMIKATRPAVGEAPYAPELWRSDGTSIGTIRLEDFSTLDGLSLKEITPVGSSLYFFGRSWLEIGQVLWKY